MRLRMALVVAATAGLLAGCSSEAEPTTGAQPSGNGSGTPAPTATQEASSPPEVAEAGPLGPEETGLAYATALTEGRQLDAYPLLCQTIRGDLPFEEFADGKSGTPAETEFRIGQQVRTNTFEATLTFRGGNRREEEEKITIRREANGVYCLDE